MGDDGYFSAAVPVGAPRRPPAPVPARRSGRLAVLLVVLLAVSVVGAVSLSRARAEVLPTLRAVDGLAPAAEGWGPMYVDDQGRPARWDPCTPIAYVVNPAHAPQHGRRDLAEALRRISAASGLRFVDAGDTDELPSRGRPAHQPDRYGARWAPLLVAWVPPDRTDLGLGGGVQGLAVTVAVPGPEGGSIVTGQVALDASRRLASGFGPGTTDGEVLQHELAHVVGLRHVDDPTQVMHTSTTNAESLFGAGDRAGLTALGAAAGCRPAPPPRAVRLAP